MHASTDAVELSEMRRLFIQMVQRPVAALVSSMGMIGQRLPRPRVIDGAVSRFVYALTRPSTTGGQNVQAPAPSGTGRPPELPVGNALIADGFAQARGTRLVAPSYLDSEEAAATIGVGPRIEIRAGTGINKEEKKEVEMDRD